MKDNAESAWSDYRTRLLAFVRSRGIEADAAEDIVHDVLMRAIAPGGGPSQSDRLLPWLYQVTRNAIIDHWRRQRPTEPVPDDLPDLREQGGTPYPPELIACIEAFLSRLDSQDAHILRQADMDKVPQAEIARELSLSHSGAKSRIQRARSRVLAMYKSCCSVELDRSNRLTDYACGPCDHSPAGGSSPCS